MKKQTAGRDILEEFALNFAELNDDVLFGEVWRCEDKLSLRDRSLVTIVALMSQGLTDSSLRYHLEAAKKNGITRSENAEILTHEAFYQADRRLGPPSALLRKFGPNRSETTLNRFIKTKWCSRLASPTMTLPNISSARAI